MAKALDVNDSTARDRQAESKPGDKPKPHKVEGKSLQVNENSIEDAPAARAPRR